MKKLLITVIISLVAVIGAGCSGKESSEDSQEITAASQQVESSSQAEEVKASDFTVLPNGAEKALNTAAAKADKAYPEIKGKRSFGYTGKKDVNGVNCYCFKVYDEKDDTTIHVADVAVSEDSTKVFISEEGKVFTAAKEAAAEKSWTDTATAAFVKK